MLCYYAVCDAGLTPSAAVNHVPEELGRPESRIRDSGRDSGLMNHDESRCSREGSLVSSEALRPSPRASGALHERGGPWSSGVMVVVVVGEVPGVRFREPTAPVT